MSGGIDTGYGDMGGHDIVRNPVGEIVRWEGCPAFVGCAERDCTGCCYLPDCQACDGDGQVVPATDDAADQPDAERSLRG